MLPKAVRFIAWFIIITCSLDFIHMLVLAIYSWWHPETRVNGSVNLLTVLAGVGLLKRSNFWRKMILMFCILAFLTIPLAGFALFAPKTMHFQIVGLGLPTKSEEDAAFAALAYIGAIAFQIYAYRVLTDPEVIEYFDPSPEPSR